MAKLVLKPQVAAFLDIVTSAGGPDLRFEEIEVTADVRAGRADDPRAADPLETGALIVALRKPTGRFDTTPDPGRVLEVGRRDDRDRHELELRALEELFAPRGGRCRLAPLARLAAGLGEVAGAPVELERPADPAHGDYATNVALRLAQARAGGRRASSRRSSRRRRARCPEVERAEVAGPGFVNLCVADDWFVEALGEIARGRGYGGGFAGAAERVQVEMVSANPTGPITSSRRANGAYGDSVARLLEFAGHEVEREYYYNDAGAQMDRFRASVDARGAGRGAARGRLPRRRTSPSSRGGGRPGAGDAGADRGVARAVPHPLRHVGAAERARARLPEPLAAARHLRADGRALGAHERARRRARTASLVRSETGEPTLLRRRRRVPRRQARARLRPRDLRARRRPPRLRRRLEGAVARDARLRPRSASRCCSTSSST